ncbi:MAG: tripartite tricarboxylate transporter substrate binding protein [Betaproteobacteria bacterium]|nr:tripartite tricarboxylate transporter substrate binding protein [Betaproteobacteria bacterium]
MASNNLAMLAATLLGCAAAIGGGAMAQEYPARPIRFIVPQPPGGPTDIVARLIGQKLSERVGQAVVIDNRPGAGSNIGTDLAAKSPADGYTLVFATIQHVVNPFLFKSLPFDPVKDFAPVTLVSKAHIVLVVNPELPAKSLQELINHARSRPGQLNIASAGNGGTSHLAAELFKARVGVNLVHVPYKGTPPALNDLLGGRAQVMFDGIITSEAHVRAGKLRALMIAGPSRSPLLPGVPSATEAGLAGFEASGLAGVLVPAGTPPAVIAKLNAETVAVIRNAELRDKLVSFGLEPVGSSAAEFDAYLKAESAKWSKLISEAGIRAD